MFYLLLFSSVILFYLVSNLILRELKLHSLVVVLSFNKH